MERFKVTNTIANIIAAIATVMLTTTMVLPARASQVKKEDGKTIEYQDGYDETVYLVVEDEAPHYYLSPNCEVAMCRSDVNEEYISLPLFGFSPLELPISEDVQKHLYAVCRESGIDYAFALATIAHESSFNENATHHNSNGTTDRGLCQVNSCWVKDLKELGYITCAEDLYNPYKCIDCGMWVLKSCVDELGNTESAYYAYNTGRYKSGSNCNSRQVWEYKQAFAELLGGE